LKKWMSQGPFHLGLSALGFFLLTRQPV